MQWKFDAMTFEGHPVTISIWAFSYLNGKML